MRFDDFQVRDALQKRLLEEVAYAILPLVEEDLKMEPGSLTNSVLLINEKEFPLLGKEQHHLSAACSKTWELKNNYHPNGVHLYLMLYSVEEFYCGDSLLNIPQFLLAFYKKCHQLWTGFELDHDSHAGEGVFLISVINSYPTIRSVDTFWDKKRSITEADAFEYARKFQERYADKIDQLISPIIEKWSIFLEKEVLFRDVVEWGVYWLMQAQVERK